MTNDLTPTATEPARHSRRWLFGAAALGGTALLAACGSDSDTPEAAGTTAATTATTAGSSSTSGGGAGGDAAVASLAAGLEVLAVDTYKAALAAATGGKLGTVPPAVATFATTAMGHHQQALDAWNKAIKGAGGTAVSTPPAKLKTVVDAEFAKVTDVVGVAKLALLLEKTAADTYLKALGSLQGKEAITLAGALQSVDQEHAAILHFVLGEYPVPDVFQKTEKAFAG